MRKLGCLCYLALTWGIACADTPLDARADPRLSRPVEVEAASIPLHELAKTIQRQTRVAWRIPDRWRETRVVVYAPRRPLEELMNKLTDALPVLEWRRRDYPDRPPEYALEQTRSLTQPSEPHRAAIVNRLKKRVELLRKRMTNPAVEPEPSERYTESDHRAVNQLLTYLNNYDHLALLKYTVQLSHRTGAEWLLQLTDADWKALEQHGTLHRWLSSDTPLGAAALERIRALADDYRQFDESSSFQAEAERLERVDELLAELRLTEDGEMTFVIAPANRLRRQLLGCSWRGMLLSAEMEFPFATRLETPDLPEWRTPLPKPPSSVNAQARWYNELGCLLLELARAAKRPLVAPHFPFYAPGDTPSSVQVYAATLLWRIREFRRPNADLPTLLQLASLSLKLQDDWLVAQHTQLARAIATDIPDSRLKQWFSIPPPPSDEAWFERLLSSLSQIHWRAMPMVLFQLSAGTISPVYSPMERRYPLTTAQEPSLYWSFITVREVQTRAVELSSADLFREPHAKYALRELLAFWRALPPALRARALSGAPVPIAQTPPAAQQAFVKAFANTELIGAFLAGASEAEARFFIERARVEVPCALPDDETQDAIRRARDPVAAWNRWYHAQMDDEAHANAQRSRPAPEWRLCLEWGEWRIEYRVQRAVCGAWLAECTP